MNESNWSRRVTHSRNWRYASFCIWAEIRQNSKMNLPLGFEKSLILLCWLCFFMRVWSQRCHRCVGSTIDLAGKLSVNSCKSLKIMMRADRFWWISDARCQTLGPRAVYIMIQGRNCTTHAEIGPRGNLISPRFTRDFVVPQLRNDQSLYRIKNLVK
jgi:hypothetical protein